MSIMSTPYKKISDYALLGDCHSAALLSSNGSIDWACFPRFDSPSSFARLLDAKRGGSFSISPVNPQKILREYIPDTNVLVSKFFSDQGYIRLTDCMPLEVRNRKNGSSEIWSYHSIIRKIECLSGEVDIRLSISPRFEYAYLIPRFILTSEHTCEIRGGADALWVTSSHPLNIKNNRVKTEWRLKQGETVWIEVSWSDAFVKKEPGEHPSSKEIEKRLKATIRFWQDWMKNFNYQGESEKLLKRSALVLKALTYSPTGAIVAAPTTSLPEEIGGSRNWDYRYTWIRDTTLTLIALLILGFRKESDEYRRYIQKTSASKPKDLQIMNSITGNHLLPEIILSHLSGYQNSYPVRIGNQAADQVQLDTYGQLLDLSYLYVKSGGELSTTDWDFICELTNTITKRWTEPDHGIWEFRNANKHFTYSKVQCWLALKRSIALAHLKFPGADTGKWLKQQELIKHYLLEKNSEKGYFTQAVGCSDVDASILLLPAVGFVSVKDRIMKKSIQIIRSELETDGILHRYKNNDGLSGKEGGFLLCSFWLIDCLIHSGNIEEAERVFARVTSLANDVGLFSEEVDTTTGELLGNFPQAFTHMALVSTSVHLKAAKAGKIPPN